MYSTVKELSIRYGIKESTIYNWVERKRVKSIRNERRVLVDENNFKEYIKNPIKKGRIKPVEPQDRIKWSKDFIDKVKCMLEDGSGLTEIARMVGMRYDALKYGIKKYGLRFIKKRKKKSYLPIYPDDERFYLNYRAMKAIREFGNVYIEGAKR